MQKERKETKGDLCLDVTVHFLRVDLAKNSIQSFGYQKKRKKKKEERRALHSSKTVTNGV